MSSNLQTIAALVVVAIAAAWLVGRAIRKLRQPGCGGDCACPTRELKR
jgi:FeoB-associated Cys-rich membrane protein